MTEYINREEALMWFKTYLHTGEDSIPTDTVLGDLRYAIPAADVVPVRHGEWEGTADGYADGELVYDMWNCSECGFDADGAGEKPEWQFCPNCGAKMDLGGTDNGE